MDQLEEALPSIKAVPNQKSCPLVGPITNPLHPLGVPRSTTSYGELIEHEDSPGEGVGGRERGKGSCGQRRA